MSRFRTILIATTAALTLGGGALAGSAQARALSVKGPRSGAIHATSKALSVKGPSAGAHHVTSKTVVAMIPVEAGSTGEGTADDKECEGYADQINYVLGEAQDELNTNGNGDDYNMLVDYAQLQQDTAEDVGCFIVNPM